MSNDCCLLSRKTKYKSEIICRIHSSPKYRTTNTEDNFYIYLLVGGFLLNSGLNTHFLSIKDV